MEEDLPNEIRLLSLRLRLLGEPLAELAIVAQAQSPTEPGAFLEGANGRPERSFEAFSLFGDETVERKRMADMTAEVLEYVRVRLGKDSLTDRAHELRGCAPFLT